MKIKVLRFDNREEYTPKEFDTFCMKERIKKTLIVPYNPQKDIFVGESET